MRKPFTIVFLITVFTFFYSIVSAQLLHNTAAFENSNKVFKVHSIQQNIFLLLNQNTFTPKPFFCRMEDKAYKRFNVLIILRAGSDEAYRKMISAENR